MATAFQPNAFQNPQVYDHFGFQVGSPDQTQVVAEIRVDQSTQLLSDQWDIALTSSDPWRARSDSGVVDISTGLINALNNPDLVKHIKDGKVDEWELVIEPHRIIGRMKGRDASGVLADTSLYISYQTGGIPLPETPDEDLPECLQAIPGVTQKITLTGAWRAKTIIEDIAQRVGLTCSYQAPDFVLRETVDINGPALAAIQQIIAPFQTFEPYKIDVWVEGTTLNVRQRQGTLEHPGQGGPVPGGLNTIDIASARVLQLKITARFLDDIRIFRATGRVTANCGGTQGPHFDPMAPGAQFDSAYDQVPNPGGGYVTTFTRWRKDDHATFDVQVTTSDGTQTVSRKTTVNTWEDPLYDTNCNMINSPKQTSSQTLVEALTESEGGGGLTMREVGRITDRFFYDDDGFLKSQETVENIVSNGKYVGSDYKLMKYIDDGLKIYKAVRQAFSTDETGAITSVGSHESGMASGHRPGGPGRGPNRNTTKVPRACAAAVIDNVPGAKDVTITSDSLTQSDLNLLLEYARNTSGAWEHQVQFSAVNIPWLRKGMILEITGIEDENGDPLEFQPMLVMENRIEYVENSNTPQYLSHVTAIWWQEENP